MLIEEKLSRLSTNPIVHSGTLAGIEWAVTAFTRQGNIYHGAYTQYNGYVLIPTGHPWHGTKTHDFGFEGGPVSEVDVHGGVTFNQDNVWGFDTGHACDGWGQSYKWAAESVRGETLYLASQVLKHAHTHELSGVEHVH